MVSWVFLIHFLFFYIAASLALDIGTRVGGLVESTKYAVARVDGLNVAA